MVTLDHVSPKLLWFNYQRNCIFFTISFCHTHSGHQCTCVPWSPLTMFLQSYFGLITKETAFSLQSLWKNTVIGGQCYTVVWLSHFTRGTRAYLLNNTSTKYILDLQDEQDTYSVLSHGPGGPWHTSFFDCTHGRLCIRATHIRGTSARVCHGHP